MEQASSDKKPATSPGSLRGFCLPADRDGIRPYLRPGGLLAGDEGARAVEAGTAWPLAGGPLAFSLVELILRRPASLEEGGIDRILAPPGEILAWADRQGGALGAAVSRQAAALRAQRPPLAGLAMTGSAIMGPAIMGIVNVTPDSFSDGGDFFDPARAIAQGR